MDTEYFEPFVKELIKTAWGKILILIYFYFIYLLLNLPPKTRAYCVTLLKDTLPLPQPFPT